MPGARAGSRPTCSYLQDAAFEQRRALPVYDLCLVARTLTSTYGVASSGEVKIGE